MINISTANANSTPSPSQSAGTTSPAAAAPNAAAAAGEHEHDADVAEWKRSRIHDEVMVSPTIGTNVTFQQQQMGASIGAMGASTGTHHSIGSRTSVGGGGAGGALYTSITPSHAAAYSQQPAQGPVGYPQQGAFMAADGSVSASHSPLQHQLASGAAALGLSLGGDYSANRLSTTGLQGSVSALAVAGGSGSCMATSGAVYGQSAVVGGSGTHQPSPHAAIAPPSSHVRTVTIHPSSSHLSDPSASSSGPGSTNDYYPVFVTQPAGGAERSGGQGPGGSGENRSSHGTTDLSSASRQILMQQQQQQQHFLMAQQQGVGVVAGHGHARHAVLLPDGSMLAPHAPVHSAPRPQMSLQTVGLPQQPHAAMGMGMGASTSGAAMLGSSTTTNVAVWGGSASRQQFPNNSSTAGGAQGQAPGVVLPVYQQPPAYPPTATAQQQQRGGGPVPHKSQFVGGRGRGGQMAPQYTPPQAQPPPQPHMPMSVAASPQGLAVGSGVRPPQGIVLGGRGVGGIAVGGVARPPMMQPPAPVLGAAPSILIGKLPTPTFTQSISVGGMRLGTSGLVVPRFPGQGEAPAVPQRATPSTPSTPAASPPPSH